MTLKALNIITVAIVLVTMLTFFIILYAPNTEIACTIERFQTLITGGIAGFAALVTAGYVYKSAKLPIEREKDKTAKNARALRKAGAATLYNAVQAIALAIYSEAAKPEGKRRGKLLVPEALPSLEVIKTQDVVTMKELSVFLATAAVLDTHIVMGTWPFDPDKTAPDESEQIEKLTRERASLSEHLKSIIESDGEET